MFFIGIDVSKAKLDCCLLLDVASNKRRAKVVANSKTGIIDLLAWCTKDLLQNKSFVCEIIVMIMAWTMP